MTMSSDPLLPTHNPASIGASPRSKLQARRLSTGRKDKGKGKAKEIPDPEDGRSVTIRFTGQNAESDLDVWVEPRETVGVIKDKIVAIRPSTAQFTLKLISSGRLLTDGILLLPWLQSLSDRHHRQARGVTGDVGDVMKGLGLTEQDEDEPREQEEKIFLHCVLGVHQTPAEAEIAEGAMAEEATTTPAARRRGFDALLDAGLTPAEVAQMRHQFYAGRGEEVPDGLGLGEGADDEHARALEEQWIEGDLTADTATTTGEGLYISTLQGLLTGFLFPLLPWFFFRDIPAPNFFFPLDEEPQRLDAQGQPMLFSLRGRPGGDWGWGVSFSPRTQTAILLGTILNACFGALRFLA